LFFCIRHEVCGSAHHTFCLDPPLDQVPEGDWLCPECTRHDPSASATTLARFAEAQLVAISTVDGNADRQAREQLWIELVWKAIHSLRQGINHTSQTCLQLRLTFRLCKLMSRLQIEEHEQRRRLSALFSVDSRSARKVVSKEPARDSVYKKLAKLQSQVEHADMVGVPDNEKQKTAIRLKLSQLYFQVRVRFCFMSRSSRLVD
jgi:hypothetical protein